MKTENPLLRGPDLMRGPSLANRHLSGPPLQPLTARNPAVSADHLLSCRIQLGNRLLDGRTRTTGPPTAPSVPLCFSRSLCPWLPSALGPSTSGPTGDRARQREEKTPPGAETQLEQQDGEWQWDPVESSLHMPSYDLSAQGYEDLAEVQNASEAEELGDVLGHSADQDARLREKKISLLNAVCCSLLAGPKFANPRDETRCFLLSLCREVAEEDPEFILKVALYTRQELNIRSTANFLLAVAALLPATRPHLRRYFARTVRLPSDWIEVVKTFQSLAESGSKWPPFPSCLRQSLSDAFLSFDEYQLAKYNSRRQRGKTRKGARGKCVPNRDVAKTMPFTLKKLVQWLHLKEPANQIMCLLGRRYPSDLQSFSRSRLPGPWDSQRAGKRMKLPVPETWERELSLHGNTAKVWERLIDNQKLPFMATLRNLRNIITCGLSPRHHRLILSRLSDKKTVIHSRQFPFRFLAAFRVLAELDERLKHKDDPLPSRQEMIQQVMASIRQRQCRFQGFRVRSRPSQAAARAFTSLSTQVTRKLKKLQERKNVRYDRSLLDQYRNALENAIEISATHNIPPLSGRTVVLCPVGLLTEQPWQGTWDDFFPGTQSKTQLRAPKLQETAVLLGLMAKHVSEHCRLVLCTSRSHREVKALCGSILSGVTQVLEQAKEMEDADKGDGLFMTDVSHSFLTECIRDHVQIDTLLDLSRSSQTEEMVQVYRRLVNSNLLFVQVDLSAQRKSIDPEMSSRGNDVTLFGYSDQILRFLCERGSCRLLEHVEKIDDIFRLPKARENVRVLKEMEPTSLSSVLQAPIHRWRTVRIFVSSTFRDMAGERDLLVRAVLPELRARAAPHRIHLQEVDLRWGITEEESRSNRQLELCLSEVSRCQLFVLILGERYGQILDSYSLPDLPQFQWVKDYPRGRSITEMELMQFLRQNPGDPRQTCFVYTRDPAVQRSIPEQWTPDFSAESEEAKLRVAELKREVKERDLLTLENYRSEWGGLLHGKPYLAGFEEFGGSVLRTLWEAILAQHCQQGQGSAEDDQDGLQANFLEAQSSQLSGRRKQLSAAAAKILQQRKGTIFLVHGRPSEGKTTFLAGLVNQLSPSEPSDVPAQRSLLYHFTAAGEGAQSGTAFLQRVCQQLDPHSDRDIPQTHRSLVQLFHSLLSNRTSSRRRLVLLVDGADQLLGPGGSPSSDWIPEPVPQGVTLVLSVTEGSDLHRTLDKRGQVLTFGLGPLEPLDRAQVVRSRLAQYGKRLEETPFNNQMRLLVAKRESHQPLYLKIASEELRTFGVFEKVSERIRAMPTTLRQMLQWVLGRLEQEFGAETVTFTFCTLSVSERGLREGDLYSTLCTHRSLCKGGASPRWEEVMQETLAPRRPIAMATFARLLRGLAAVSGVWGLAASSGSRLRLSGSLLQGAVEQRYLREGDRARLSHLLLAAHLWRLTDPAGDRNFTDCDPEALADLPLHLVGSGQHVLLSSLLSDLGFSWLHLRLGMLPQLGAAFARCGSAGEGATEVELSGDSPNLSEVRTCQDFVAANSALLSRYPLLFWQQALNQEEGSLVERQARKLLGTSPERRLTPLDFRLICWVNRPQPAPCEARRVMKVPSIPECVGVSATGKQAVVGTRHRSLHLLDLESGQEVQSLVSEGDGVSCTAFLSEGTLCTTSFDGKVEVWDLSQGCRLLLLEAHSDRISGCAVSPDGMRLATCSWDRALKVWAMPTGTLDVQLHCPCPLNCVAFRPDGHLLATGGWDHTIRLWKWLTAEPVQVLNEHQSSVQSLAFSPDGDFLVSASLQGDVLYWCLKSGSVAGSYQAHRGSVTALRFLDEGRLLLSTGEDQKVQIWSGLLGRRNGEMGAKGNPPALCMSVSENGGVVAVGYHSGWTKIFDLGTGKQVAECEGSGLPIRCLQWLSGEEALAAGGDDCLLRVWGLGDGTASCRRIGRGHLGPLFALGRSSQLLASVSADCTLLLWTLAHLTEGEEEEVSPAHVLRSHTDAVTCCSFSPQGHRLVTGSRDKSLLFWDLQGEDIASPRGRRSAHRDWVTGCCWGPQYVASCSSDGLVRLWNPESIECIWELRGRSSPLTGVHIMDELLLSVTGTGDLLVWKNCRVAVTSIPAHTCGVNALTTYRKVGSKEGTDGAQGDECRVQVLTAADDGLVRRWDPLLPEEVATLTGHGAVVRGAAAENHLPLFLTVAEDQTLRVWDVPRGQGVQRPSAHCCAITALGCSSSGRFLASGSMAGEVALWESGKLQLVFQAHQKQVSAITFLSDQEFAVGSYDGQVSVWLVTLHSQTPSLRVKSQSSIGLPSPVCCLARLGKRKLLILDLQGSLHTWEPGAWLLGAQMGLCDLQATGLVECADGSVLVVTGVKNSTIIIGKPRVVPVREDLSSQEEEDGERRKRANSKEEEEGSEGKESQKSAESEGDELDPEEGEVELKDLFCSLPVHAPDDKTADTTAWITAIKQTGMEPGKDCYLFHTLSAGSLWRHSWDLKKFCRSSGDEQESFDFRLDPQNGTYKQIHSDRVTAITETENVIATASYDRTVRLWDRDTLKQVGLFLCRSPVLCLVSNPACPGQVICGDNLGNVYFLGWRPPLQQP
ncbi:telomerase protein component 1 isoform X3 [Mobula hypostoma]